MDKYKRYYGIIIFIAILGLSIYGSYSVITPKMEKITKLEEDIVIKQRTKEAKEKEKKIVENKLKKIQDFLASSQKKIYSPVESDLGDDSLFFTLYNDTLEMIRSNSVKIKAIDYTYNPKDDPFVISGGNDYFVSDVKMELVSNYINLGKLIQEIYQYPYYIKIVEVDIKPYEKDKKILLTNMTLRLYAHTDPLVD